MGSCVSPDVPRTCAPPTCRDSLWKLLFRQELQASKSLSTVGPWHSTCECFIATPANLQSCAAHVPGKPTCALSSLRMPMQGPGLWLVTYIVLFGVCEWPVLVVWLHAATAECA